MSLHRDIEGLTLPLGLSGGGVSFIHRVWPVGFRYSRHRGSEVSIELSDLSRLLIEELWR